MELQKQEIEKLSKVYKLNLINSLTGIKPANLIGTKSTEGVNNLAIFSSVVHLGSNPPLIGFILRPYSDVRRDTYENIKKNGFYTINHVPDSLTKNAHYTSAKFEHNESEFDFCGFTPENLEDFDAPFVLESPIKIGLRFVEEVDIAINGTTMIIGEIEIIQVQDDLIDENGYLNLDTANVAGISGLNSYYSLKKIDSYPYARRKEVPTF